MEEKRHHNHWEQQWLEGKISSEDAAKYAKDASFDAFEKFIQEAKHLDVPRVTSKEQAWNKFEAKISANQHSPKVISISRRNWFIGVAASFILALGAFFLLPSPSSENLDVRSTFETSLAEKSTIYLPDSSSVYLNAASSVSFSKETWNADRSLDFDGEAFFEVKRGSKFTVKTSVGQVTVLGTSFNVRVRNGELIVSCMTGKVGVSKLGEAEMVTITPGEMVSIREGEFSAVSAVNTKRIASWRSNEFDFESMALSAVFKELERQYSIKIKSDFDESMLNEPLTGTIPTNDLDVAVRILETIKGIKAEYSNDAKEITFMRK